MPERKEVPVDCKMLVDCLCYLMDSDEVTVTVTEDELGNIYLRSDFPEHSISFETKLLDLKATKNEG